MKLEIHPVALAKLGTLTTNQALRLLGAYGMFNRVECFQLTEMAGCVDRHETWTPYVFNASSPFLIYEGADV